MEKFFDFELTTDYKNPRKALPAYLQMKAREAVDRKCVFTQEELETFMNLRDDKNITFPAYLFIAGYPLSINMISALEKLLNQFQFTYLPLQISRLGYVYSLAEIKELNQLQNYEADVVMGYQMDNGIKSPTIEELINLNLRGWGIAHKLANRLDLDSFSVDNIIALGDRRGDYLSLSHVLAQRGRQFTGEEIEKLRNPVDDYGATLAHRVAFHNPDFFTMADLVKPWAKTKIFFPLIYAYDSLSGCDFHANDIDYYGCVWLAHQGATVAHIMAREGHKFKSEEISLLENPVDGYGLSLRDWQEKPADCLEKLNQIYQDFFKK